MIILSNNLWNCDYNSPVWEARGESCAADARIDGLVKAYTSVMPDILGFQEMSRHMERLIVDRMSRVALPDGGTARYEIVTGGFTPILFRHDRFLLLESGHRIYPEAFPPYEGSFNDCESKGYTFGVFENRTDGKRITVISTHLWWKTSDSQKNPEQYQAGSAEARAYQFRMASACADGLIGKYGCPVILMGDLNAALGSPCLNAAADNGWISTHDLCTGERSEVKGHHFCYGSGWRRDPLGSYRDAIDHILIKSPGNTSINRFLRFTEPFYDCLSDHYPVYIDLTL